MSAIVHWINRRLRGLSFFSRYVGATVVVAIGFGAQQLLVHIAHLPGFSILLTMVFACAALFGRGTGFYAALLANLMAAYALGALRYDVPLAASLILFGVMSTLIAGCGEGLRFIYERARRSEERSQLLLRELHHRTQNTLSVIVSLIEMQAGAAIDPKIKDALKQASMRVRIQSEAHRHLDLADNGAVDAPEYLKQVCSLVEQSVAGILPITIKCRAQKTTIGARKTLAIGIIANELITNSIKYAFREGEAGTIYVELDRRDDGYICLRVADDGHGCPDNVASGLGTRLLQEIAKEHNGTYQRHNLDKGCETMITFAPRDDWALTKDPTKYACG